MSKHTLFICKSCHLSEARPEDQPTDGTRLLDRLNQLNTDRSQFVRRGRSLLPKM